MTADSLAAYLAKLERALRSLPAAERDQIIAEITSHIADSTAGGGKTAEQALQNLGDPLELAKAFLDQRKLEDAVVRSAHGTLLIAILERAGRSVMAGLLGLIALILYLCTLVFGAMAVLKPILPQNVGYWNGPHLHAFAIIDRPPSDAVELLGYWIIPLSVALGIGSFLAGRVLTRFGGRMLLRKTHVLPG